MDDIIKQVALELNLSEDIVRIVYKSFYSFIKDTIEKLPLKEELTEEQFNNLRCNFNIPSLGKLYISYPKYKSMKERFNYIKKLKEDYEGKEDKANVY